MLWLSSFEYRQRVDDILFWFRDWMKSLKCMDIFGMELYWPLFLLRPHLWNRVLWMIALHFSFIFLQETLYSCKVKCWLPRPCAAAEPAVQWSVRGWREGWLGLAPRPQTRPTRPQGNSEQTCAVPAASYAPPHRTLCFEADPDHKHNKIHFN